MKLKRFLKGSLGVIGSLLYFVIMFLIVAVPAALLSFWGVPRFVIIIITAALVFIDLLNIFALPILYIVTFFIAIHFEVMWLSIAYFICLAIYLAVCVIPTIYNLIAQR